MCSSRSVVLSGTAPSTGLVFGVDLGGTKVLAALAGVTGDVIAEVVAPTDPRGGLFVIQQIHAVATALCAEAGITAMQIQRVVVGSPGVVDPNTGGIRLAPNIPGFSDFDVALALRALFQKDVLIENDVKLAMLGEVTQGRAKGCANAAFLSIGTGVGLGLMVNGQLLRGATGAAGEIAYLPLGPVLDSAEARQFGAFELAVGSVGILRHYQARGGSGAQTVRDFFERVVAGEAMACTVLDETARTVALAITALVAIVDPAIVVMGGGIGSRDELVERVQRAMASVFTRPVHIAASTLGQRAGLLGAISLAQKRPSVSLSAAVAGQSEYSSGH